MLQMQSKERGDVGYELPGQNLAPFKFQLTVSTKPLVVVW
jgi:hypothetical protein